MDSIDRCFLTLFTREFHCENASNQQHSFGA
jgi:hypothetical protein